MLLDLNDASTSTILHVNNAGRQPCSMPKVLDLNDARRQRCSFSTMRDVNNARDQRYSTSLNNPPTLSTGGNIRCNTTCTLLPASRARAKLKVVTALCLLQEVTHAFYTCNKMREIRFAAIKKTHHKGNRRTPRKGTIRGHGLRKEPTSFQRQEECRADGRECAAETKRKGVIRFCRRRGLIRRPYPSPVPASLPVCPPALFTPREKVANIHGFRRFRATLLVVYRQHLVASACTHRFRKGSRPLRIRIDAAAEKPS